MEGSQIPILENFPLISKTMPYYGYTHRMLLLLSIFSKKSRRLIIDNYKAFIRIMRDYCLEKEVCIKDLLVLNLPYDLFKFKIESDSLNHGVGDLVALINKLINGDRLFFDEHNMNEKICISRIYLSYQIVLESLTSFEELISERNRTTISRHALRELDSGLSSFKKIRSLRFDCYNEKYQLSQIKNAHITDVEILDFNQLDINCLENTLNSDIFIFKVKSISYRKNSLRSLNDAILDYILKINPQELYLSCFISLSVSIRVLSCFQKNKTLFFGCNPSSEYTLKFSNTFVYFKDENTSCKLYCKEIWFKFEDMEEDDIIFLDNNHICISSFEFMKIAYFEIIETNEADSESIISENSDIDSYCTIPLSALSEITFNINELLELMENSKNKKAVSTLSPFIKFTIKLQSASESFMFENVCKFVPNHCELELNCGIHSYLLCYINTK